MHHEKMPGNIEDVVSHEQKLLNYSGKDRVVSFNEKIKLLESEKRTEIVIMTGIPGLDLLVNGARGGELIIISGPTKGGKTTFCRTLTRNFIKQKVKSLWFSFEMGAKELFNSFPQIPEAYLPAELSGRSTDWIFRRCEESKLKYNTRAVFIDHLHFLVDMDKIRNPSLEIGALVRKIKRVAVDLNLIVFLVCHIAKIKLNEEPTESDLRDSSFIAQDADTTWMIFRKRMHGTNDFGAESRLSVRNHRRTGVMAKKVDLVLFEGWLEEATYI